MAEAYVKCNMARHFAQILRVWGGKECTHVKVTETIDDIGQVIDKSTSSITIYGIISPASFDEKYHGIGFLQAGDLTAYFKYSEDVIVSKQLTQTTTRYDRIIYQGNEYKVEQLNETVYDVSTPIFSRYLLRKVSV